jgi:phosphoribosylanthranilate isomerase
MPSGPGPIPDDLIAKIALSIPPPVATFLLTSETSVDAIVAHARRTRTTTLQLVDWVDPDDHQHIRRQLPGVKLVQVLHVEDDRVLEEATVVASTVDALLLDSGRPTLPVRELGGTGRVHDWELSRQVVEASQAPVFLAGGLNAANVSEAIAHVHPFGVDLCTGVRAAGHLDQTKLQSFMSAMKTASRTFAR